MTNLFEPFTSRGMTTRNRLVVSPMCQYSCDSDGMPGCHHDAHLGRFALGGFGLVFLEASAVSPEGRISPHDLGIWDERNVEPLSRLATMLQELGAKAGIQLAHAGPKASTRRPWEGGGPLDPADAWPTVSAANLDEAGIKKVKRDFVAAAGRADRAGFDVIEIHGAHGYLLNTFSSPLSNRRPDRYGKDPMLLPLEVVEAVREVWPDSKPLFYRVSAVDAVSGGDAVDIGFTVEFARRLAAAGVDVIDCSSGGIGDPYSHPVDFGYQVPHAAAVREQAGVPTMAVGLVVDPPQAEAIVGEGNADLVALAREALFDPNWPLHARLELEGVENAGFTDWPRQAGSRLAAREELFARIGRRPGQNPA